MESYGKSVSGIRAGERITVVFTRNGKLSQASAIAVMRPYEQSVIADVQYDWVKFRNGISVRSPASRRVKKMPGDPVDSRLRLRQY